MCARSIIPVVVVLLLSSRAHADKAISVEVDARAAPRRVLSAKLVIPAQPGTLAVRFPKWMPGEHGPTGPYQNTSKLVFTAGGKTLAWVRDSVDLALIRITVPTGASEVTAEVESVLPAAGMFSAGATATEQVMVVSWHSVLLYPDGKTTDDVRFRPALRIPTGWKLGTALPIAKQSGDRTDFDEVTLTTLVDSPVLAGAYFKEIELAAKPRVRIVIAADSPEALAIPDDIVAGYKRLVAEAKAMYGATHYNNYTFLLTLSDRMPHFGLEHHESSDNRMHERVFLDEDTKNAVGGLLAHEYTHSWNGKYRRPEGLQPGHFDVPMQGDLLWVYEGLTEYLGRVLAARAGLEKPEANFERFAANVATLGSTSARTWRPLADTTTAAQQLYEGTGWTLRTRGVDFYSEGAQFWLEVDATIRTKTKGAKSLDDFCSAFFGGKDSGPAVVPYKLDDVIKALDAVVTNDWRGLIEKRITNVRAGAPVEGIEAAGWKLDWTPKLPARFKLWETLDKEFVELWSVGIVVDKDAKILDVAPGSPADRAGLVPEMKLVAVAGRSFDPDRLREAVARTKTKPGIEVITQNGDVFRVATLDVRTGLRYPMLVRKPGTTDVFAAIVAPKAK